MSPLACTLHPSRPFIELHLADMLWSHASIRFIEECRSAHDMSMQKEAEVSEGAGGASKPTVRARMMELYREGKNASDARFQMKAEGYKKARISTIFNDWPTAASGSSLSQAAPDCEGGSHVVSSNERKVAKKRQDAKRARPQLPKTTLSAKSTKTKAGWFFCNASLGSCCN